MKSTVSLCMIVKNEEKYLHRCLSSIKDSVDEMIIVDTGSTDGTVEIAKSFNAKVYFFEWNSNFSEARNESLKYATKDWILILDGDDEFCSEDIQSFKELLNSDMDPNAVYSFETLNYCGSTISEDNISVNLNPRLFKNNNGYCYEGTVHNQLVNRRIPYKDITKPIRIYHYGYLEDVMKSKDKRSRNIPLLEEQLRLDPKNRYAHFNLGNEYYSIDNITKALEHYYKSYEDFNPNSGYGFILIARIIVSNLSLSNYDKALEFAEVGIKYYPNYTDLYFLKALVYNQSDRLTLEIKALEKCVELGDPPSELKFIYGTGGYKAYFGLGNAYMKLKDYDTAYKYYIEAIRAKRDFVTPIYVIGHMLKEKGTPIAEFKEIMESFFSDYPKGYQIIADVFYLEGYYDVSLEYVKKCESVGAIPENLMLLKIRALVRTGAFMECLDMNEIKADSAYNINFALYKVISALLTEKRDLAKDLLDSLNGVQLSDYSKLMVQVYEQLVKMFNMETTDILSEDENEKLYTPIIFEICEILLINKKYDEFEMALGLLNLISDKTVLLTLGKLYYKYGYIEMAKKELIRSVKEFEVYDSEGMKILCS